MKIENIELIKKIINNISIPEEFGTYDDGEDTCTITDLEEDVNRLCSNTVSISSGATKLVIIPEGNVVIKIPFTGSFSIVQDDETEEEEEVFDYFYGANDTIESKGGYKGFENDYCVNELYKYNKAIKDGFGEFFAELEVIKNDYNESFYLQEKIITKYNYNSTSNHSENSKKVYDSLKDYIKYMTSSDWMQDVIDYYGEEKAISFFNYLYNNGYNDLHYGNLGYKVNGAPILFDLAGYRE